MEPHKHTPAAIRERLEGGHEQSYLKDFIYGAIDGTVTTFAVVSGVAGANLPTSVVVILGLANLVGDGFSMAAGNFLGTRAEQQILERARRSEERQVAENPVGETEEVRQIFMTKGFEGEALEAAVAIVTSDKKRWVDMMLQEELGLSLTGPAPLKAAVVTFLAFVAVGLVPLVVFLAPLVLPITWPHPYLWSTALTGIAFFCIGAAKSIVVEQKWYWAGLETLAVGGSAAVLAYAIGAALQGLA